MDELKYIENIDSFVARPCKELEHEDRIYIGRPAPGESPDYWAVYMIVKVPDEVGRVWHEYEIHLIDALQEASAKAFAQALNDALPSIRRG